MKYITILGSDPSSDLAYDSANPLAIEAALKVVKGRALINSVNGEEERLESILPLVAQYDAAVIGLCMDDDGIPTDPEVRVSIAQKILDRAAQLGIKPEDILKAREVVKEV